MKKSAPTVVVLFTKRSKKRTTSLKLIVERYFFNYIQTILKIYLSFLLAVVIGYPLSIPSSFIKMGKDPHRRNVDLYLINVFYFNIKENIFSRAYGYILVHNIFGRNKFQLSVFKPGFYVLHTSHTISIFSRQIFG